MSRQASRKKHGLESKPQEVLSTRAELRTVPTSAASLDGLTVYRTSGAGRSACGGRRSADPLPLSL